MATDPAAAQETGPSTPPDATQAPDAADTAVGDTPGRAGMPGLPGEIDLAGATATSPTEAVQKSGVVMSELQRSGVELAKCVLLIITSALLVLTLLVGAVEFWPTSEVTEVHKMVVRLYEKSSTLKADDPQLPQVKKDMADLTRQIVDAKQAQRAFWLQFAQMILLNLLLPVLTAILGYVFGASSSKS
ncbi:MAG: hypothetical protein H0X13_19310 [Ramlibacter sp.]|nr:hypothetical protein [Ramlibacter sp.]